MSKPRSLSVYERNQLLKYSYKESDLLTKGNLPIEYLTGFVNFAGLELMVNQNVLIPRVETEELVNMVQSFLLSLRNEHNIATGGYLEVGTGSGAISVSVYDFMQKQRLNYDLYLTDISAPALALAEQNFLRLWSATQIKQAVHFQQMHLLADLPPMGFQVIVANLPYLPSSTIPLLDESVRDFEPKLALDGGADGFMLINQLLEQIWQGQFLAAGGKIFLEVDESHTLDFVAYRYPQLLERFSITAHSDQFARHRFLVLELR